MSKRNRETTTDRRLLIVLEEAWRRGFTVQSHLARAEAELVAMAASLSLITTRIDEGKFSRSWQITAKGLRYINEQRQGHQTHAA